MVFMLVFFKHVRIQDFVSGVGSNQDFADSARKSRKWRKIGHKNWGKGGSVLAPSPKIRTCELNSVYREQPPSVSPCTVLIF